MKLKHSPPPTWKTNYTKLPNLQTKPNTYTSPTPTQSSSPLSNSIPTTPYSTPSSSRSNSNTPLPKNNRRNNSISPNYTPSPAVSNRSTKHTSIPTPKPSKTFFYQGNTIKNLKPATKTLNNLDRKRINTTINQTNQPIPPTTTTTQNATSMKQRIDKLNPRYNFPSNDLETENAYIDTRSELDIFKNIIHTINREVNIDLLKIYEKMLQRSPLSKEILRQGITITAQELQKEVSKWKKENLITIPEAKEMTSAIHNSLKKNLSMIDDLNIEHITPISQANIQDTKDNNEKHCEPNSNMCISKPDTEEIKNKSHL